MRPFVAGKLKRSATLNEVSFAMHWSAELRFGAMVSANSLLNAPNRSSALRSQNAVSSRGNVCCTPEIPPQILKTFLSVFISGGDGEWSEPMVVTCPDFTYSQ